MKIRLLTAAALVGTLALSLSGAEAATPVLDGKKVKVLTLTAAGGAQTHDQELASIETVDKTNCAMPRCARIPFTYKPAKGVKGDLMLTVTWTNPASDIDLYFAEVGKGGSSSQISDCASFGGPSEKIFVPAAELKAGKTYVLVADFFRSANETIKAKVEIAVPNAKKTTVPAAADEIADLNCTL